LHLFLLGLTCLRIGASLVNPAAHGIIFSKYSTEGAMGLIPEENPERIL